MMLLRSLFSLLLLAGAKPILAQPPPPPPCTDCWCVPRNEMPDSPACPPLQDRELLYLNPPDYISTIAGFLSHTDTNPVGLDPANCQPYPDLVPLLTPVQLPCNEIPVQRLGSSGRCNEVCGFKYDNTDGCDSGPRSYEAKTYQNKGKAIQDGAVITHAGRCGVCSNHQDLAAYLNVTLDVVSAQCGLLYVNLTAPPPPFPLRTDLVTAFFEVKGCYRLLAGFTDDCAHVWASNALSTAVNCWEEPCKQWEADPFNVSECCKTAVLLAQWPPNNETTCEINGCLKCDEENSGEIFKTYAGRTRRNSGTITPGVKRPCESIENLNQDPCANPPGPP